MNAIVILSLLLKVAVSIQPIPDADDSLHIYALPVGQGDCTVIQCPRGKDGSDPVKGTVTIIDAGSSNNGGMNGKEIVEFLAGTRLNFAVITHSNRNHWSYMNTILKFYGEREIGTKKKFPNFPVYHSCAWSSYGVTSKYAESREVPTCAGTEMCDEEVKLCPHLENTGLSLNFVASGFGGCQGDGGRAKKEDFIIALLAGEFLVTGDFELSDQDMNSFLDFVKHDLSASIYRLSHHGAWMKNTKRNKFDQQWFLNAVNADYVFSSSEYGHPKDRIYKYYKEVLRDIVAKHDYTYYENNNNKISVETRKPMYVTRFKKNGIIKFNIDPLSNICVEFIHIT